MSVMTITITPAPPVVARPPALVQAAPPRRIRAYGRLWDGHGYLLRPDGTREYTCGGYWRLGIYGPYWVVTTGPNAGGFTDDGYPRTGDGERGEF